jgi:hypothetical protein
LSKLIEINQFFQYGWLNYTVKKPAGGWQQSCPAYFTESSPPRPTVLGRFAGE